ncbi:MAG: TonB-dependent receptor [Pseudomonadota bacterium]
MSTRKHPVIRLTNSSLSLAVAAAISSGTGVAQTSGDDDVMEEVIVRALKRDQTIYEAPVSLTAISETQLQQLGTQEINDYLQFVPNVTVTSGGGRRSWDISIRGLSVQEGVANTYGVFLDEFNVSPTSISAFNNPSLQDAAQIEVLRGPQGVYFGRSIMAGAINITTNKPSQEFEGDISARVGSNERYQVRGAVSGPLIEDTLSFRLLGYYEEFGGFMNNLGPIDVTNDFEESGVRLALRWTPGENTTIDIAGAYVDAEDSIANTVPVGIPIAGVSDFIAPLTFGAVDSLETLAQLQGTPLYPAGGAHTFNVDEPSASSNEAQYLTVRGEHDFGGFSLVGVAGYMSGESVINDLEGDFGLNETEFLTPFGAPATLIVDYDLFGQEEVESYSLELRLQSNDAGPLQWVVGVLYAEDEEVQRETDFLQIGSLFLGDFAGVQGAFDPFIDNDMVESRAVFGDISYAFFDQRLTLSAGARYSDDSFSSFGTVGDSVINGPGAERPKQTVEFTNFAPTFTAAYSLTDNVNVYAKAANAYRPGGLNNNPLVPEGYDSEDLWNFELGFKGLLMDGALDLRAAAYVMKWDDVQTNVFDPDLLLSFLGNASEATFQGFEVESRYLITERLIWEFGLGYTSAEYDKFEGGFVPNLTEPVDLSGTTIPLAPEWTVNTQLQYTQPLGSGAELFLRGEYQFVDEQFATPGGEEFDAVVLDSYELINLRAGFTTADYSVTVFAENLADEYYLQGSTGGIYPLGLRSAINEGRRFGIRGQYFF